MTDEQEIEEILLVSTKDIAAIDYAALQNITQTLVQINPWRRQSCSVSVYDDQYLEIKHFELQRLKHYWLNLAFLADEPTHARTYNWRWGIATLALGASAGLMYFLSVHTQLLQAFAYRMSVIILLCTFSLLSVFAFIYNSKNEWQYRGRHSGVTLLRLMHNKPSKQDFKAYIAALNIKIRNVHATLDVPIERQLAAELGEHRRLQQEGILSADAYAQAKQNILHWHGN